MKLNRILGAIPLFICAICTMPAIAAPPDSPPRAQVKQNIESEMPAPAPNFLALYAEKSCDTPRTEFLNYFQIEKRSYVASDMARGTEHYDVGDH